MKIIQLLPTIAFGDAVGNDTVALKKVIEEMGFETAVYSENIDPRLPEKTAYSISEMPEPDADDIIIYHKSTGTQMSFTLGKYKCRKMMIYHNVTPPQFFKKYNLKLAELTNLGIDGVKYLADKVQYCMADSEFNRQELINFGYQCDIDVRPILIPFEDYKKKPSDEIIKKYSDGYVNIIFVGRIAPNKKQEDAIRAFEYYKTKINPKSRLIFIGSYDGMESYYDKLRQYVSVLGVEDVIFTGHIKFNEILAYYRTADIFLCMSEHEGFCVPLAEAMFFGIPIVAYNCCAIPHTLGGSGVLIDDKDPVFVSMLIDRILNDDKLKEQIIKGQNRRLEDFSYESVKKLFKKQLTAFIGD